MEDADMHARRLHACMHTCVYGRNCASMFNACIRAWAAITHMSNLHTCACMGSARLHGQCLLAWARPAASRRPCCFQKALLLPEGHNSWQWCTTKKVWAAHERETAGGICRGVRVCGRGKGLRLHHITYVRVCGRGKGLRLHHITYVRVCGRGKGLRLHRITYVRVCGRGNGLRLHRITYVPSMPGRRHVEGRGGWGVSIRCPGHGRPLDIMHACIALCIQSCTGFGGSDWWTLGDAGMPAGA
eukprot:366568-Chlamydomonas_euryale.AAC.12